MAVPVMEPKGIPTIFGEVFDKNVTFCIDTSGSMYKGLDVVKEHLIETLQKHARKSQPTTFNIIEFNSEVTQWADKMVKCSPETVHVAMEWINKLSAKTGTNTQDALLTALSDQACGAIYLVTDGLPDQHPSDILDNVIYAARSRPIHCIYFSTEEKTESAAIELLEDLSIETFGSFHIVTLTLHGCVERITPIYRADHANERIIRTINGTIHPHVKSCSVATNLQVDPDESLYLTPRVSLLSHYPEFAHPWSPYHKPWWMHPYRYYYPHAWSRYRPAKAYLKSQEAVMESIDTAEVSPAAGALMIGKRVLARRLDDGYFYSGQVKSQILSDKFLVAFGPCKHGKYKETEYQDTFIYDIIDYEDSKRHTILTGDKVLAPWEPEGERFGPGVVIEGQEKRQAEGPDDREITVTFSNGKTERVPGNTAVWIPSPVYERLALELKMPRGARETLQSQDSYPKESLTGYPTSGPEATPPQYEHPPSLHFDADPVFMEAGPFWKNPYYPTYPIMFKHKEVTAKSAVKSEEVNALVPGTNMTQRELDEKVMSQLMEHKLKLDEQENEKNRPSEEEEWRREMERRRRAEQEYYRQAEFQRAWEEQEQTREQSEKEQESETEAERNREMDRERDRLLRKREKQEENTLRKSVHFADEGGQQDVKVEDLDNGVDSGLGSDPRYQQYHDLQNGYEEHHSRHYPPLDEVALHHIRDSRDIGQNTDSSLLFQRPMRRVAGMRPPWKKYWANDPAPPLIDTNTSPGGFRETALQAPLEARNQRPDPNMVEWASPVYKYVDPYAKHDYSNSVELLMRPPKVQNCGMEQQGPAQKMCSELGWRQMSEEERAHARRDYRRRQIIQRQEAWDDRLYQEDAMQEVMQDNHRQRIQQQMNMEKERQQKEQNVIRKAREAKKHISAELRAKIEAKQLEEQNKDQKRINAMKARREHREAVQEQKEQETQDTIERRQQIKAQRSHERWIGHSQRLDEEEQKNIIQNEKVQNAKIGRRQHFHKMEQDGQKRKDLRVGVTNQHLAMYRSQVFP